MPTCSGTELPYPRVIPSCSLTSKTCTQQMCLAVLPCLQDYCALTLPHSAAQPMLARHMTMLSPVPGRSFPQVVLLLHRASLALQMGAEWEVRLSCNDAHPYSGLLFTFCTVKFGV